MTLSAALTSDAHADPTVTGPSGEKKTTATTSPLKVNAAPTAVEDGYMTNQDSPLTVAAPGVLANDTDRDGDTLTAAVAATAQHGSVVLNGNGSFTYRPATNYVGTDTFAYVARDPSRAESAATVRLLVTAANGRPEVVRLELDSQGRVFTNDTLSAYVVVLEPDPSVALTVLYEWRRNDQPIAGRSGVLPVEPVAPEFPGSFHGVVSLDLSEAGNGDHGDTVTLAVSAKNAAGIDTSTASVTVGNTLPSYVPAVISPATPTTNDTLTAVISELRDDDGDVLQLSYQWNRNGAPINGATCETLDLSAPGNGDRDDQITVLVTVDDGHGGKWSVRSGAVGVDKALGYTVGMYAPDFEAYDLSGNRVSLQDFRGRPLVLAFSALWCTPSQQMDWGVALLNEVLNNDPRLAAGFAYLPVELQDRRGQPLTLEGARQFAVANAIPDPVLHPNGIEHAAALWENLSYGVANGAPLGSFPTIAILDPDLRIRRAELGPIPPNDLQHEFDRLLPDLPVLTGPFDVRVQSMSMSVTAGNMEGQADDPLSTTDPIPRSLEGLDEYSALVTPSLNGEIENWHVRLATPSFENLTDGVPVTVTLSGLTWPTGLTHHVVEKGVDVGVDLTTRRGTERRWIRAAVQTSPGRWRSDRSRSRTPPTESRRPRSSSTSTSTWTTLPGRSTSSRWRSAPRTPACTGLVPSSSSPRERTATRPPKI